MSTIPTHYVVPYHSVYNTYTLPYSYEYITYTLPIYPFTHIPTTHLPTLLWVEKKPDPTPPQRCDGRMIALKNKKYETEKKIKNIK